MKGSRADGLSLYSTTVNVLLISVGAFWFVLFVLVTQPPTRSPQKSRRGETGHDEKEDAEIAARNKQEMYSRPPPTHKKSIAPSTVSRRVINCTTHVNLLLLFFTNKLHCACHKFNVSISCLSSSDSYSFFLCLLNVRSVSFFKPLVSLVLYSNNLFLILSLGSKT